MSSKIIPYGRHNITDEDIQSVIKSLQSDALTQGPTILEFEKKFAEYIGCNYAVAVANGTAALHLCAMAMKVDDSCNIITTPITFAASANCIRYCNGNVYFADIVPGTYILDPVKTEELILSKPEGFFKGIIVVDFAGYAANLEVFQNLAIKYNLWIIEDACHAPGGYFIDSKGIPQLCGNGVYSDLAVFSFHPVKHIACGEGGMITTNNVKLYNEMLKLRTHGITRDPEIMFENQGGWYYEMQELGYNYRLTDFQAALGISQLKRADDGLERRKQIAKRYSEAFKNDQRIICHSGIVEGHAYHLYIIEVMNRKSVYNALREKNIFCQVHYIPVHSMPYYRSIRNEHFPIAEKYYEQCLSLPMFPTLTDEEQDYVINSIREAL